MIPDVSFTVDNDDVSGKVRHLGRMSCSGAEVDELGAGHGFIHVEERVYRTPLLSAQSC